MPTKSSIETKKKIKVVNSKQEQPKLDFIKPPSVYIPIPSDEKRKLFTEFLEMLKPEIFKISSNTSEKANEPIKKMINEKITE